MKRKNLAIIYLFILSIGTILSLYIPKNEVTANDALVIPNDAIRLRILANSDSSEDQAVKRMIRDEVNKEITNWVSDLTSKEEAREVIKSGIPEIQKIAEQVMEEENMNQSVKVEFGVVDFPTKLYGQFLYPAGQYEAILITLGEGTGANWWCVLFPPLCFLDFSNGVAVSEGFDEEEEQVAENKDEKKSDNEKSYDSKEDNEKFVDKEENSTLVSTEQADSQEQAVAAEVIEASAAFSEEAEKEVKKTVDNEPNQAKSVESKVIQTQSVEKEEPAVETEDKQEEPASVIEEVETQTENNEQEAPIYIGEDEEPVEVKFFVKEIWDRIFG
ncbi:stage II sporulation protein R [Niallia endozanthoxylica]|uniref:Stage II sporulation protein R n=1 Tax=Niallia endozanthoxylica TaxID=2036016 RepID=A0A5J5HZ65_9BACI|nr:stage II sporulation protein R [Niallia endozanthoxylica]